MGIETAIIGGALIGGLASNKAAKKQAKGVDRSIAEQRRQFDLNRSDLAPFRETGVNALGRLNQVAEGDFSGFFTSPDFNFRRDEGLRGIENRFSASGGTLSGNALRRLTEFNSGLASQEFGNFFNRNASLAGIGQNATNQSVVAGQNSANNISNSLIQQGNARASGVAGINDAVQGGISNFITAKRAGLFDKKGGV